jgi:6-phosphogluconolactonase
MRMITTHEFPTRNDASEGAARFIGRRLRERLAAADTAGLVVSGGSTPVRCFEYLSTTPLDWERVRIAMSDERWIPPGNKDSNETLVRTYLVQNAAAAATLLPVYAEATTPEERASMLGACVDELPRPFACTLLGMGSDGHFASLFPDAPNLSLGLDAAAAEAFIPVRTGSSPHPRISMTLGMLLDSEAIVLLFFGDQKRGVYESAPRADPPLPITALLEQQQVPVHVFWAA